MTTDTWTFTPPQPRPQENKEERTVHCQYCSESFFYESGLRTHMEHAHVKEKENEDTILAEKLARQEMVLSTIPKTEVKKGKNTKKDKGKGKQSKISENKWPFTRQKYREMQEDEFKSKKSDMEDNEKKKKYELRNRKQDEDITDNSMSLTDAMSILDKHKTHKSVAEDNVMKKGNVQEETDIAEKPWRRTRSSIPKQTITEPVDSQKTNESGKNNKNTDKQSEKVTRLVDSSADGKPEDTNANDNGHGMQKEKNVVKAAENKKAKNKEKKNKKSLQVPEDDLKEADAENSRRQT